MSAHAPAPGDTAPDFTLPDADGNEVSLSDLRGPQGDRLLLPGRDDPGLHQAGLRLPRLARRRCRAPATRCSASRPDKPAKLAKFRERDGLHHPAARPTRTSEVLEAYGAFGEKKLYGKTVEGVIRSTFVVDEEGKVERAHVQRQGDRPRRQAAPRPRVWTPLPPDEL